MTNGLNFHGGVAGAIASGAILLSMTGCLPGGGSEGSEDGTETVGTAGTHTGDTGNVSMTSASTMETSTGGTTEVSTTVSTTVTTESDSDWDPCMSSGDPCCFMDCTTTEWIDPCASDGGAPGCDTTTDTGIEVCLSGDAKLVVEDVIAKTIAEHLWVTAGAGDPMQAPYAVSMYVTDFEHAGDDALPGPCVGPAPGVGSCGLSPASGQWYCQRVGCEASGVRSAEAWITSANAPDPDLAPGLVYDTAFPAGTLDTDRPYRHWFIEQVGASYDVSSTFMMSAHLETGSPVEMTVEGATAGPIDGPFTVTLDWPQIATDGGDLIAELMVPLVGPGTGTLTHDGMLLGTYNGTVTWLCP